MQKKTINDITLYDLMAEDFCVWVGKNNKFGYDLHIEGYENDSPEVEEEGIHPCAIDSMADFCNRFLSFYNKINKEKNARIQ